jgi:hypothetical protein
VTSASAAPRVLQGLNDRALCDAAAGMTAAQARKLLAAGPGVRVVDDPSAGAYPLASEAAGGDDVLVSDATRDAAGRTRKVEFGERELHWLKNVPEPVAARSASRHQCGRPRRPLEKLSKLVGRGERPSVSLRHSEVVG